MTREEMHTLGWTVVWDGGEGLTSVSESLPNHTWVPAKRIYNKTGKYAKKEKQDGTGSESATA